jgi:hypothetical protein
MQDNGELSSQRHPCFAITRSLGDRARPLLQARGSLDPRQDNDSGLVQQSTSERIAAPRYSATAIDLARLILSRREPEVHPYGSRSDDFVVITIGKLYLSPSAYRWFRKSRRRAWSR